MKLYVSRCGRCKVKTYIPKTQKKYNVDYVVVQYASTPLLSKSAVETMGIITVNNDAIEQDKVTRQVDLVKKFSDVFSS